MKKLKPAKIGQCHNYCIFLASMHFESIDDFINLETAVKRFRGNLEPQNQVITNILLINRYIINKCVLSLTKMNIYGII